MSEYTKAKALGLTDKNRWEDSIEHHPESVRMMNFLEEHDIKDYARCFNWKIGGDGDDGETLMYQMDAYFEFLDSEK